MTIRKIIYLPDPRLRQVCKPLTVDQIKSAEIQELIDDMFETMYAANGVGLAANQIGICLSLAVIDVEREKKQQYCLINPEIIETRGEEEMQEGCLSVPGGYNTVKRPTYVKVRALDRNAHPFELESTDLLAECVQHEVQHLNGKLYIDLLSPLKRELMKKKSAKFLRAREK